jgi:8-oxo-dGTP pyrophosphatase MutT (NUDIX family)
MTERLIEQLRGIVDDSICNPEVGREFLRRLNEGKLTRDENPESHYCVYFAAYDPETGEVFVGHHIRSGLWLFNGGHIDERETPAETLVREAMEEWGQKWQTEEVPEPSLLTITEIDNPKQTCRRHYDIWYFLPVNKSTFKVDDDRLAKEFHEIGWKSIAEARALITDPNTLEAVDMIGTKLGIASI